MTIAEQRHAELDPSTCTCDSCSRGRVLGARMFWTIKTLRWIWRATIAAGLVLGVFGHVVGWVLAGSAIVWIWVFFVEQTIREILDLDYSGADILERWERRYKGPTPFYAPHMKKEREEFLARLKSDPKVPTPKLASPERAELREDLGSLMQQLASIAAMLESEDPQHVMWAENKLTAMLDHADKVYEDPELAARWRRFLLETVALVGLDMRKINEGYRESA